MAGAKLEEVELGLLARPGAALPTEGAPGVVLIHDVWGPSEHSRDLVTRLAEAGFLALAIDFYRREEKVEITDPGAWIRDLPDPQVMADVAAGVELLKSRGARKVGVTGVCMGGMYAILAGCEVASVDAIAPFYGMLSYESGLLAGPGGLDPVKKPRSPLEAISDLQCPMLAFFGAQDTFVSLEDVASLERRCKAAGKDAEVVIYPGAGHAFLNTTRPQAYHAASAEDAWVRMCAFFRERLAGPSR